MNLKETSDKDLGLLITETGFAMFGHEVWMAAVEEFQVRQYEKHQAQRKKAQEETRWSWENGGRRRSRIAWPLVPVLFVGGCWLALVAQSAWPVFAAVLAFFALMVWADGPKKPH